MITIREIVKHMKYVLAMVHSMIEKEVSKGTPASRIVLGGFSQVVGIGW